MPGQLPGAGSVHDAPPGGNARSAALSANKAVLITMDSLSQVIERAYGCVAVVCPMRAVTSTLDHSTMPAANSTAIGMSGAS
jgi:hypothetical protein